MKYIFTFIFIMLIVVGCGNDPKPQNYKPQLLHAYSAASNKIVVNYESDGLHALQVTIEKDQHFTDYSPAKGICSAELTLNNDDLTFKHIGSVVGPFKLEGRDIQLVKGKSNVRKDGSILLGTYRNNNNEEIEITTRLVKY